jgi:hypothetical protein
MIVYVKSQDVDREVKYFLHGEYTSAVRDQPECFPEIEILSIEGIDIDDLTAHDIFLIQLEIVNSDEYKEQIGG